MNPAIRFERVSKLYRLGMHRMSLPSILAGSWHELRSLRTGEARPGHVHRALDDVSFSVDPGHCLALIGPNGAGKTTILKLLAKITRPTKGSIEVNGRLSALIELGAGFHPDLTGRENVFLNGAILGLSRAAVRRRFDEIVAFSELEPFIDTPVKRYSSGMIVRLGFAVAASVEPEILLVDEVLAVGDARFRQKCLQRIQSLVAGGTSIVFVSHDMYMVRAVCDTALYLRGGKVASAGSARDVIDTYERYVHMTRAAAPKAADQAVQTSPEFEITSVEVCGDSANAPDQSLSSQEPATIRVKYRSNTSYRGVNASLFIKRSDGLTCCMMRTSLNGGPFPVRPGDGTLTLRLDRIQLITGSYAVDAFFLNDNDSIVLTPAGGTSDWFFVKGASVSTADDSGVYEPIGHWSHD
jgi:lipopolysaccharide transport system ATP-binding protein